MDYLDTSTLRELQQLELEILKTFIDICTKLKLRWFAQGGTVLGAVRHQGFIPWDDDIDVAMPRKDYEIFLKEAPDYLPAHLFLQTYKTDPGYLRAFAKIRNSNTTFIETACKNIDMNHGIYIDVFPLDGYSNSTISDITYKFKKIVYDSKIDEGFYYPTPPVITRKNKCIRPIANILNRHRSLSEAVELKDKLVQRFDYDKCETVGNLLGAWFYREIVPKSFYGEGVTHSFENIDIIIPSQYDLYLSHMYGDYMKLPSEKEQVTHHPCEVIDLHNPYQQYL